MFPIIPSKYFPSSDWLKAQKHGKNSKNTTRRATSANWRIFAELKNPKRALSKVN